MSMVETQHDDSAKELLEAVRGEEAPIPEEDRSSPLLLHQARPTRLFVKLGSSERTESQRSRVRLFEDLGESWEDDIAGGAIMLGEKLNIKSELYSRLRST